MTTETLLLQSFHEGKARWPKAIVAVEYDNCLYFFYNDAELVSDLFHKPVDRLYDHNTPTSLYPVCLVPKDEHNDLSLVLYENKFLMVVIKTEPQPEPQPSRQPWQHLDDFFSNLSKIFSHE